MKNAKLPRQLSVIEYNRLAWNRSKDPLVEFVNRQQVPLFEEKLTVGPPEKLRKAIFQVYDNSLFKLCATYPTTVVLPAQASQAVIAGCASFRSKNRLPALSYFDQLRGNSIWRSSQPCNGFFGKNLDD